MKRIVMHWTAGGHKANATDKDHYHLLIEGDGNVVYGNKPISANAAPLSKNYAAHTAQPIPSAWETICAPVSARPLLATAPRHRGLPPPPAGSLLPIPAILIGGAIIAAFVLFM